MKTYIIAYYDYYNGEHTAVIKADSAFRAMVQAQMLTDYGYVKTILETPND